ncbi:MAG: fructose-bisphosphatase class III, partial [Clostridia bacterium]|nr:fructose-bisphosphatase class III [Clostridia bacterium]
MEDIKYLKLLAREFPNVAAVSTEIINLSAILCLPKGTEHMISDIHGEYGAFLHMLKNASGVVREKIDLLFEKSVPQAERDELATLIYYPREKLELIHESCPDLGAWYAKTLPRLTDVCRLAAAKYTRSKVRKALPQGFEYIIDELLHAADTQSRQRYQETILSTIVDIGRADAFIVAI